MEADEDDDNFPLKKIHLSNSMTDATDKATGITVWVWMRSGHHGPNPSHHGSQEEGPNHSATATDPYMIPNHIVKDVANFDTEVTPSLSASTSTKQQPQQQIVDSDGSDAQIQRSPRKALKTVSMIQRIISIAIDVDLDGSFALL